MDQISFEYEVKIKVRFTREEVNHLILLSQHHYDRKCKDASCSGGFLYRMKNSLEMGDYPNYSAPSVDWTFDSKDLGVLHKITEGEQFHKQADIHLWFPVGQLFKARVEEWERITKEKVNIFAENEKQCCCEEFKEMFLTGWYKQEENGTWSIAHNEDGSILYNMKFCPSCGKPTEAMSKVSG